MRIEQSASLAGPAADQQRITVRTLRVTGASVFAESDLLALTGFRPDSELTLADLQAMVARITGHYRRNGFFVAQAYLPAQDIKDGAVTIALSEGRYGSVDLRNQTTISDRRLGRMLEGLNSGDVISTAPLESRLLLLSDVRGANVRSTLVPGASPGTSDLVVEVTPGRAVSGSVDADNAGNPYTGSNRIGATVDFNNPLGLGDVASLRVLTSGQGLKYGRASYQLPVGSIEVGAAYSRLDYSLGKQFQTLGANGTAEIASVYARHAVFRSRNASLYLQIEFDAKKFQDRVDSTSSRTDKKSKVVMASVYGDYRDALGQGGFSTFALTLASGSLDIGTPAALAADNGTARASGRFQKLSFSASHLQRLDGPLSVYAGINGQAASKNLDVSEKMELGGMNAVRAYPEGEAYADEGYIASVEARVDLPKFSLQMPGQMQVVGFVDTGRVMLDKNPWVGGENQRTLSAAGVGLVWSDPGNFMVRNYYAQKLGHAAATSYADHKGRFWIQAVKYF